jgi:Luciferase-like monooxygenase
VLAWVAGFTQRIGLGTSIVLVPLHHPIRLAKEVATLQELSGGRVRLGVGMGWHKDEFRFMGYEFAGQQPSRRCPSGSPSSGSAGAPSGRFAGARELGDVWHPSRSVGPDEVKRVKERYPQLRVVPRTRADQVDAFLDAGAEGAVVSIPDEASLRDFAERYR